MLSKHSLFTMCVSARHHKAEKEIKPRVPVLERRSVPEKAGEHSATGGRVPGMRQEGAAEANGALGTE